MFVNARSLMHLFRGYMVEWEQNRELSKTREIMLDRAIQEVDRAERWMRGVEVLCAQYGVPFDVDKPRETLNELHDALIE